MAEIKIEKKKPIWPWVLTGLGIAALLLYFLAFRDNATNTNAVTETDYISETKVPDLLSVKENNSTVAAYINFVENTEKEMSLDHVYSNEALLKLIDATSAIANEVGYVIQSDLEKIKEHANMITKDPLKTTHADNIRMADDTLTTILQKIQLAKYPTLAPDIEGLKRASESVNPDVLTLQQKDAVKNYFAKAADLLKKMN